MESCTTCYEKKDDSFLAGVVTQTGTSMFVAKKKEVIDVLGLRSCATLDFLVRFEHLAFDILLFPL